MTRHRVWGVTSFTLESWLDALGYLALIRPCPLMPPGSFVDQGASPFPGSSLAHDHEPIIGIHDRTVTGKTTTRFFVNQKKSRSEVIRLVRPRRMGKTRQAAGGECEDNAWGEIPDLGRRGHLEDPCGNVPSGLAETREMAWYDGGAHDADVAPWADDDFYENARLTAAIEDELVRGRSLRGVPLDLWPTADLERVARFLRSGR